MIKIPRYLEIAFFCFALWFFIGNPINLINKGVDMGQVSVDNRYRSSNSLFPAISMLLYLLSSGVLVYRWKLILSRLRSNPQFLLLLTFVCLICISYWWSYYPNITSRRSILFAGSTILSVVFSLGFSFKEQIRILAIALCINVVI